jgi:type III restriction enzyme
MMAHFRQAATGYEVQLSRGFAELKPFNYTATAGSIRKKGAEIAPRAHRLRRLISG